ncbi:MAG TPA: biotin/lipoyl-binding protein [Mycobacteriales bacterium]|nr:biotin/lipoyl-binding protein [Mycobacteriales bacterium]
MPDADAQRWQQRRRHRGRAVAAGAVVLVVAGAGTAWGLSRGSGPSYRTAKAGNATVLQTLSATGTVSPVSHADESFEVSGTVADVAVKTGEQVHAGQVLAQLDRTELRNELRSARSTLAAARNRMSADESGQSLAFESTSSGGSSPTFQAASPHVVATSPPSGREGSTHSPSGGAAGTSGGLVQAQNEVRATQQQTDEALAAAGRALAAADQACPSTQPAVTAEAASTDPEPSATSTPDPVPTASSAPGGSGGSGDACTEAGAGLLAAQQTVDKDEQAVAEAETALTRILSGMAASASNGSTTTQAATSTGARSPSSTGSSAADIALDQASIDQALATVDADRATVDQATLRATIAGRVAAVTVSHGDQVSASSTSPAFVIVGSKQEQTTVDLSATEIRRVRLDMTAKVVADGSSKVLTGQVVAVDAAGTEASTGSVTYPVTVALPSGTDIVSGTAASVTLVVASVNDVLAVPTSAVHYSGTTAYVEVLEAGKPVRKTVKTGAVGAALTEVESGIASGEDVVLANLNAAVPSSSSNSSATFGGAFEFPGGGVGGLSRRFSGGSPAGGGTVVFGGPAG